MQPPEHPSGAGVAVGGCGVADGGRVVNVAVDGIRVVVDVAVGGCVGVGGTQGTDILGISSVSLSITDARSHLSSLV